MRAHDVVILGGGHNGLTAAAYLARAGLDVLLLERDDHLGGAAVSAEAFQGVDARLSRYSYLVSLLPARIVEELGLEHELVRRRFSSYTPDPADPARGLLVDRDADDAALAAAFARVGAEADVPAWRELGADTARLAALFPTLTEPLPTREEARALVGDDRVWRDFVERPLGETVDARFTSDLVRGVVATDGLIGTFTGLDDPALDANRCFLYHVIGGGTGDWDVPVGGMGAVTGELERVARAAGATLLTGTEVLGASPEGAVRYRDASGEHVVAAGTILANVAPAVLDRLLAAGAPTPAPAGAPSVAGGEASAPRAQAPFTEDRVPGVPPVVLERLRHLDAPEGAQVKVNLLLTRLPRLRDPEVAPEQAFAGTFHINELASQLEAAFRAAARGAIPDPLPCEIYCHTLSDPSILSPELAAAGAHTLTVFGLHAADRLGERFGADELRERLQQAVLDSLDSVLAEPIAEVIARDASGRPCIETKTTRDLEAALAMPGGHIFHGPLSWPWAEPGGALATHAERWGVATAHERILLCGSGAVRGGAVSGIGGQNAAMAVLEARG
ncbi:NAD(P)/FAD-dependent oxidoreductase [Agromyces mediolanus]|uniref:phytoene desaturase family protein n=1 Tax=Agromyces mediolanus TaxID=41986 RepID=UPI00203DF4B3|nr:NAD(P)/FAD-dependent oxidoreductase [Agromyces mediolanus]MCM3659194.1 NAD(P)/FAD-dependent oxidoreductase [Agromyces mediolanus]